MGYAELVIIVLYIINKVLWEEMPVTLCFEGKTVLLHGKYNHPLTLMSLQQISQVVQEVRITNQTMYMHPAIEQARYQIMEQLFGWQAIVTSQNRIQSTRYQVCGLASVAVVWI